jgi:hypothetical protein
MYMLLILLLLFIPFMLAILFSKWCMVEDEAYTTYIRNAKCSEQSERIRLLKEKGRLKL